MLPSWMIEEMRERREREERERPQLWIEVPRHEDRAERPEPPSGSSVATIQVWSEED